MIDSTVNITPNRRNYQDAPNTMTNNPKLLKNSNPTDTKYANKHVPRDLRSIREKMQSIIKPMNADIIKKDCTTGARIENNDPSLIRNTITTDYTPTTDKKSLEIASKTTITISEPTQSITFTEADSLKQIRKRTFSHWSRQYSLLISQLILAGFFGCNVGDRTICIYCNIICQQWNQNSDDPCEVHKVLSPKCSYVIAMLVYKADSSSPPLAIINETSTTTTNADLFQHTAIVYTSACHPNFIEIPKRYASFSDWPSENVPSVDDLVRAGFFFTGDKTIVTCFYCNGSLQNWGVNDNPMIEHARWFPHCAYAKQLCGGELYQRIQESKKALQERTRGQTSDNPIRSNDQNIGAGALFIPDESTLSRLVAARLDLPISQRLLDQKFKLSIIKRCWEDQLRLKQADFVSDSDLWMGCNILRKQIDIINGNKDKILVPSVAMKKIREKKEQQIEIPCENIVNKKQEVSVKDLPKSQEVDMKDVSDVGKKVHDIAETKKSSNEKQANNPLLANACVLCQKEEKRLACIPCGHLVACSTCGKSIRWCPTCRLSVEALVRVYL